MSKTNKSNSQNYKSQDRYSDEKGCAKDERSYNSSNSRRSRKNRGKSKTSTTGSSGIDRSTGTGYGNDPTWWNKTGQFAKDATSFSFGSAVGSRMAGFEKGVEHFTPSGIMVLQYTPCLGAVSGASDPINVAARQLYDVINAKNSRNPSYDPSDLMTYILAVANAWSLHAWLRRGIGLMLTYAPQNRYVPDALLQAMGFAKVSAQNDIVTWRNVANRLALRLNMLAVPKGIDYFKRAIFMNSGIYMDDQTSKASLMFFNPRAFLALHEADSTHDMPYLYLKEFTKSTDTALTPAQVEKYINEITSPLFNSTDIATMSSDIIKAYGLENCFTLPAITESELTIPEYNPEVLMQINNAMELCDDSFIGKYEIYQDMTANCLKAKMEVGSNAYPAYYAGIYDLPHALNMPIDNPTNDMVMIATRLMFHISDTYKVDPVCTEILVGAQIYKFKDMSDGTWGITRGNGNSLIKVGANDVLFAHMERIADYEQFNSAPLLYAYKLGGSGVGSDIANSRCLSDIRNYTTITQEELRILHEAALLSIFSPLGGK